VRDGPASRSPTRNTGSTAAGHWFGTSPEFWLNLQKLYELRIAREDVGAEVDKLPVVSSALMERLRREEPRHVEHTRAKRKA